MECRINGVAVHYVEHGTGTPLVALHGAGVDHREIEAAVEAIVPDAGYRRIYPDLPGMGRSTAEGVTCNDDVVSLLGEFVDHLAIGPALLVGHSYGAYLARGLAAQRPDTVLGLALICPVAERSRNVPDHEVVHHDENAYDELEPGQRAGFDEYIVVRTPATARRYRDYVAPGTTLVDETALGRIFAGWTVDVGSGTFSAPTLIAMGRRDSVAGYSDGTVLLERYPRATLAVIGDAGHALMHERPDLFAALIGDCSIGLAANTHDSPALRRSLISASDVPSVCAVQPRPARTRRLGRRDDVRPALAAAEGSSRRPLPGGRSPH